MFEIFLPVGKMAGTSLAIKIYARERGRGVKTKWMTDMKRSENLKNSCENETKKEDIMGKKGRKK